MKVNLKNYSDNDFPPIPQGWYHVEVIKAEMVEKEGKSPYVKTWFKILEGESTGRYVFHNFIFTEKAVGFMKPYLIAINYSADEDIEIEPNEWLGEQLLLLVGHEEYQGAIKERVMGYKSLESESKEKIASEEHIPF